MDDDVLFSTLTGLATRLRKREFSSVELTRAYLDRLREIGPRLNAVARLTEERALRQAGAADRLFAAGRVEGPLQGIPYGAKDLLAARGAVTSWGAEPYRDQTFDYDETVVRKLEHAGAVLAAKLAMVRFAGGGGYSYPTESMHGPGKNPWNPEHWAGGSSTGPGIAVAAGLTPFAIGSETWGSIVTPASHCGVTGLRPTYGLVSRHGAMALSWTMDKVGADVPVRRRLCAGARSDVGARPERSRTFRPPFHARDIRSSLADPASGDRRGGFRRVGASRLASGVA